MSDGIGEAQQVDQRRPRVDRPVVAGKCGRRYFLRVSFAPLACFLPLVGV
jgi:hypothetical protein